jgi:hypothetical protein
LKIREIHKALFNTKLPNNFAGVDVFTTLKLTADKFNLNFKVFTRAPKTQDENKPPYVHFQTVESSSPGATDVNILLCYNKEKQHVMFIKDIEALTKFHTCPKCQTYLLSKSSFEDHKERFDKRVNKCDGKYHSDVNLKPSSLPYHPTLLQNSEYLRLYAEGKQDQYKFTRDCMCFDFETVENVINQPFSGKKEASTWDATLIRPLLHGQPDVMVKQRLSLCTEGNVV